MLPEPPFASKRTVRDSTGVSSVTVTVQTAM